MAAKLWKMTVTTLGSSDQAPLYEISVEAENWMAALRLARTECGEVGAVPPGASCTVAPDGHVTVADAAAQRRYTLKVENPSIPPPAPQLLVIPKAPKVPSETLPLSEPPAPASLTEPARPASSNESQRAKRSGSPSTRPTGVKLLHDVRTPATLENPVAYRERWLGAQHGISVDAIERALLTELELLEPKSDDTTPLFLRIALFEGITAAEQAKSPRAALSWRSWHAVPEVEFIKAEREAATPAIVYSMVPPAQSQDDRLADAFEVCQDLPMSARPADALELVRDLLSRTIPCDAVSTALYDIDRDELRFVAVDGLGADERRGTAVPSTTGLVGAAVTAKGGALLIEEAGADPRFIAESDSRKGMQVRSALVFAVTHEGRLLGLIQLLNRLGQAQFSRADAHVVTYVGKQLGEYLHSVRVGTDAAQSLRPKRL